MIHTQIQKKVERARSAAFVMPSSDIVEPLVRRRRRAAIQLPLNPNLIPPRLNKANF